MPFIVCACPEMFPHKARRRRFRADTRMIRKIHKSILEYRGSHITPYRIRGWPRPSPTRVITFGDDEPKRSSESTSLSAPNDYFESSTDFFTLRTPDFCPNAYTRPLVHMAEIWTISAVRDGPALANYRDDESACHAHLPRTHNLLAWTVKVAASNFHYIKAINCCLRGPGHPK
jgi:hypothetical protein